MYMPNWNRFKLKKCNWQNWYSNKWNGIILNYKYYFILKNVEHENIHTMGIVAAISISMTHIPSLRYKLRGRYTVNFKW